MTEKVGSSNLCNDCYVLKWDDTSRVLLCRKHAAAGDLLEVAKATVVFLEHMTRKPLTTMEARLLSDARLAIAKAEEQ